MESYRGRPEPTSPGTRAFTRALDLPSSPRLDYLRALGLGEAARNGSLGRVFDHVGVRVSDLTASERFYRTVLSALGVEPSYADAELVEWEDWAIGPPDREHPLTRGLHVGFRARDRARVDAFWQAGVDAGYRDDGAPGPRPRYGPTYYGGFLLDPDGNSVEAVHGDREDAVPDGWVDHLWIRVRDPQASRRFYETIAPHAGLRLVHDEPGRVQLAGPDFSFSLVRDERPITEHVHLAFPAGDDATVRAFHAAALAAGYEDHGAPASARSTTRATTARSCSTRTGTTSRSSTTTRAEAMLIYSMIGIRSGARLRQWHLDLIMLGSLTAAAPTIVRDRPKGRDPTRDRSLDQRERLRSAGVSPRAQGPSRLPSGGCGLVHHDLMGLHRPRCGRVEAMAEAAANRVAQPGGSSAYCGASSPMVSQLAL